MVQSSCNNLRRFGGWSGRGKRGIKVTGALRSAGFQKIPARPQIVFNRFTGLNMLV